MSWYFEALKSILRALVGDAERLIAGTPRGTDSNEPPAYCQPSDPMNVFRETEQDKLEISGYSGGWADREAPYTPMMARPGHSMFDESPTTPPIVGLGHSMFDVLNSNYSVVPDSGTLDRD